MVIFVCVLGDNCAFVCICYNICVYTLTFVYVLSDSCVYMLWHLFVYLATFVRIVYTGTFVCVLSDSCVYALAFVCSNITGASN